MASALIQVWSEEISVAELRQARKDVANLALAEGKESSSITAISNSGESMTLGQIRTMADREMLVEMLNQAIALSAGSALPAGAGVKLDFSTRCAST